jgi:hypothetical protein
MRGTTSVPTRARSAPHRDVARAAEPGQRLYARGNVRRLQALLPRRVATDDSTTVMRS